MFFWMWLQGSCPKLHKSVMEETSQTQVLQVINLCPCHQDIALLLLGLSHAYLSRLSKKSHTL